MGTVFNQVHTIGSVEKQAMIVTYQYYFDEPDGHITAIKRTLSKSRIYHNALVKIEKEYRFKALKANKEAKRKKKGSPAHIIDKISSEKNAACRSKRNKSDLWWPQKRLIENTIRNNSVTQTMASKELYPKLANYPNPGALLTSLDLPIEQSYFGISGDKFWFTYSKPNIENRSRYQPSEMLRFETSINITRPIPDEAIIRALTISPRFGQKWLLDITLDIPDGFQQEYRRKDGSATIIIDPTEITLPNSDLRMVTIGGLEESDDFELAWSKRLSERWLYSYQLRERINSLAFEMKRIVTSVYFPNATLAKKQIGKYFSYRDNHYLIDDSITDLDDLYKSDKWLAFLEKYKTYKKTLREFRGLKKSCHAYRQNLYMAWAKRVCENYNNITVHLYGHEPRRTSINKELIPTLKHQAKKFGCNVEINNFIEES